MVFAMPYLAFPVILLYYIQVVRRRAKASGMSRLRSARSLAIRVWVFESLLLVAALIYANIQSILGSSEALHLGLADDIAYTSNAKNTGIQFLIMAAASWAFAFPAGLVVFRNESKEDTDDNNASPGTRREDRESRYATDRKDCLTLAAACRSTQTTPKQIEEFIALKANLDQTDDSGHSPLQLALLCKQPLEIVRLLLNAGADPNATPSGTATPINLAIESGNHAYLATLLDAGADPNSSSNKASLPLHLAIERGDRACIELLIDSHADLNSRGDAGEPALSRILRKNEHLDLVEKLIRKGADIRLKNKAGESCIHIAARWTNDQEAMKCLIKAGADIDATTKSGDTPLSLARDGSNSAISEVLESAGASVTRERQAKSRRRRNRVLRATAIAASLTSALVLAAYVAARKSTSFLIKLDSPSIAKVLVHIESPSELLYLASSSTSKPEIIITLLNSGAYLNSEGKDGLSPLHLAARDNTNIEVIRTLIEAGANVNADGGSHWLLRGHTPLSYAVIYNENPEVITALIKAGADVNAEDIDGQTLLDRAIIRGKSKSKNAELIRAAGGRSSLFDNHPSPRTLAPPANIRLQTRPVSIYSFDGPEARLFALCKSSDATPEMIQQVLELGADVNAKDEDGWTPLDWAARYNENPEVITTLIKAGADVNAKDVFVGQTPLHLAARYNENPEVITTLIKAGADVNAKDVFVGQTPLDKATERNAEVLRAAGGKRGYELP